MLKTGLDFWMKNQSLGVARLKDDDELLREAWEIVGADLLREHIEERPGTRPWGWWAFGPGAEEDRRVIAGELEAGDWYPPWEGGKRRSYFGKPSVFSGRSLLSGVRFETELAYLERLGLLAEGERERAAELHEAGADYRAQIEE
jgi:hypothetical protein